MSDWNTAEREREVNGSEATEEQCYGQGRTHRAYGWARSPSGAYCSHQRTMYDAGYDGLPFPMKDGEEPLQ